MKYKQLGVQVYCITASEAGQRLDNYLLAKLKKIPKSKIYKMIRKGEVRINGGRIKPYQKLKLSDRVRVPPLKQPELPVKKPSYHWTQVLRGAILYEDEDLLALNKPVHLPVHSGSSDSMGVIEYWRDMNQGYFELVHRLDKETSGCLLIAKKRSSLRQLQQCFIQGQVTKYYLTLTQGKWPKHIDHVRLPLKRFVLPNGERRVKVSMQGSAAHTFFSIQQQYDRHTLLKARLFTGRTHQIRVHAQQVGCPIVGDEKYTMLSTRKINRGSSWRHGKLFNSKRIMLHATSIELHRPNQAKLLVTAPLEQTFIDTLNSIRDS